MLTRVCSSLTLCLMATVAMSEEGTVAQVRQHFAAPGAEFRAKPLNQRNYPTGEAVAADLKAGHWGGINAAYPEAFRDYLRDPAGWQRYQEWMAAVQQQGMTAWIYDEHGYPSGRAGGLVLKGHPEWEAQGLFHATTMVVGHPAPGGAQAPATVAWELPPGTPFLIVAYPLAQNHRDVDGAPVDVTGVVKDGKLSMTLPATTWNAWRLHAFVQNRLFEGTHASLTGGPMPNILDPEAVRRFIEVTHGAFATQAAAFMGKTITATFTDEVSLNSGYLTDAVQPYAAVAWYHGLPALYRQRTGHDIRECLPALVDDTMPNAAAWRCSFYELLGDQVAQSYYRQVRTWCAEHGVASTGHLLWEESLVYHAHFYGNIFPSYRELDWPGIDVLWCKYGQAAGSHADGGAVTPKLASSAAHLGNKPRTISESFWDTRRDQVTIEQVMEHYAWQSVMGINTLTTITVQDQYPPEELARFNEVVGRLNGVMTQGRFAADVAILYPIASVQAHFKPTQRHVHFHDDNPIAADIDLAWRRATEVALAHQRDFDYLDEATLAAATVEAGQLVFQGNRYAVVVLPQVMTLHEASLQKLRDFTAHGGTVIAYRGAPRQSADIAPSAAFAAVSEQLWSGAVPGVVHAVTDVDLGRALRAAGRPALTVTPATPAVNYQRRVLADGEVYLVINTGTTPVTGDFTFAADGVAEVLNPFDGSTTPPTRGAQGAYALTLPPHRGLLVMFRHP